MGADTFSPGVRKIMTVSFILMGMPSLVVVGLNSYGILEMSHIIKNQENSPNVVEISMILSFFFEDKPTNEINRNWSTKP